MMDLGQRIAQPEEAPMTETRSPRTTVELERRHFAARSTGFRQDGTEVIGPVLFDVVVTQTTNDETGQVYAATYSVEIDGRHQFGGFARHLDDGLPSGAAFLADVVELTDLAEYAEEQRRLQLAAQHAEVVEHLWKAQVALDQAGRVCQEADRLAAEVRRLRIRGGLHPYAVTIA
jgi:hypothetical protein